MAKVDVTMPKMGESITEGTIIAWFKEPGDSIDQDETILEIGTDKVDTEVPSPTAGTLVERLVDEGDTVDVGTVIAVIETEEEAVEDIPSDADPTDEAAQADHAQEDAEEGEPEPADEHQQEEPEEVPASGGEAIEVVMPKMGESITEGTIISWFKEPGDKIDLDETIVEIGTDKVDTEVPSPAEGYLKERLVDEGDTVEVGTPIAILTSEKGADVSTEPTKAAPASEDGEPEKEPETKESGRTAEDRGPIPRRGSEGQFFSPLVRSIAEEEQISQDELESIEGSGREGRVTKEDVMAFLEQRSERPEASTPAPSKEKERPTRSAPAPAGGDGYDGRVEIMEMDRMRQITAEHMVRSKSTSAHVTSFAEADVTNLVRLREKNKEAFLEREGVKLTFTPFFVQAAVEALKEHPVVNASVDGNQILLKKDYHIGIAVAIGKKGLMAPVIRHAARKNLVGIAHAAADLAERARSKQLQPDEIQGGSFTVTNIGSLGSIMGTPIISQPQVGILATGAIKKRPVVVEDPKMGDVIAIRHIMYACLSYDHRIIDGAMGASFLQKFTRELESHDPDGDI